MLTYYNNYVPFLTSSMRHPNRPTGFLSRRVA